MYFVIYVVLCTNYRFWLDIPCISPSIRYRVLAKTWFSMSTFQRSFYNENSGGHFSVADSVLRQMPEAYAEDVHGTSIKTLILVRRTFKDYWWQ